MRPPHGKYIHDPFFQSLAEKRGWTEEKVLRECEYRRYLCENSGLNRKKINMHRLTNPFMGHEAWWLMFELAKGERCR